MENRVKRLIAVGASVAANCQPCLQHNVDKAKEDGVAGQEITDAIEVGKMVRKGAASKMDAFASSLNLVASSTLASSNNACACGS